MAHPESEFIPVRVLTSNPAELDSLQYPLEGYKYLGCMCKLTAFKTVSIFLFYVSVFGE